MGQLFVCSTRMQVEAKSNPDEIPSHRTPTSPDSGMYLFRTVPGVV